MTTIVTILTDGWADWETTLLNAVAHAFYNAETHFAAPGGRPVTSAGGLTAVPDMRLEDVDPGALDALIVNGGTIWQLPQAPDLTGLLRAAKARGKVIGAICDGTVAAAKAGILDEVAHTSNGAGYLDTTGYGGKARYRDVPHAVADGKVVTASATAPVSFAELVLKQLGIGDEQLDYYLGLHAQQFQRAA